MSTKGLVFDYFSFVNFAAILTIGRLLFEPRYIFDEFFWYDGVFEIKINNFLVGNCLIANFMLVVLSLQNKNDGIL